MKKKHLYSIKKLTHHYNSLFLKHKDSHNTAQQSSKVTQEKRMNVLIDNLTFKKNHSVLDFGCGTGHLYEILKKKNFDGRYFGIDISDKIIEFNNQKFSKNKKMKFQNIDILNSNNLLGVYDFIFINGTFNNLTKNNWKFMTDCLKVLFKKTRIMLAFNNLSYYVDYYDKDLFYVKPEKVFYFCKKNLSQFVTLRNEYQIKKRILPFEFTTYVYKKKNVSKN